MPSKGGTELAHERLMSRLPDWAVNKAQIISREEGIDHDRLLVFWTQDMPDSPQFLADPHARAGFDGLIFVSYWQQTIFGLSAGVPFGEGEVIKNAVEPLPMLKDSRGPIKLIYQSVPDRGLELLVPVFDELSQQYDIVLDVYSNFELYGQTHRNEKFEALFEFCRNHDKINYHGSVPNDEVREAVSRADIFAYPAIWLETSCMSAMEAMSGGCLMVAPHWGALPETMAGYNVAYSWTEDKEKHKSIFKDKLRYAIENVRGDSMKAHLEEQKRYADKFYNWDTRINEWIDYIQRLQKRRTFDFPGFNMPY
jgi:glycosyltransferase involved in cell wall biosynthesis